jgi:hypothetical protein
VAAVSYQYRVFDFRFVKGQELQDKLNDLGDVGWRLVSVNHDRYIFIRDNP